MRMRIPHCIFIRKREGAIESETSQKLMAHANCFLSLSYIKLLFALHLQAAYCL